MMATALACALALAMVGAVAGLHHLASGITSARARARALVLPGRSPGITGRIRYYRKGATP